LTTAWQLATTRKMPRRIRAGDGRDFAWTTQVEAVHFPHVLSLRVIDGPFTETKELLAGFWLWQCKNLDEAIEWLKRAPFGNSGAEVEIRQIFEADDFGANLTPETRAREERIARQAAENQARL